MPIGLSHRTAFEVQSSGTILKLPIIGGANQGCSRRVAHLNSLTATLREGQGSIFSQEPGEAGAPAAQPAGLARLGPAQAQHRRRQCDGAPSAGPPGAARRRLITAEMAPQFAIEAALSPRLILDLRHTTNPSPMPICDSSYRPAIAGCRGLRGETRGRGQDTITAAQPSRRIP